MSLDSARDTDLSGQHSEFHSWEAELEKQSQKTSQKWTMRQRGRTAEVQFHHGCTTFECHQQI